MALTDPMETPRIVELGHGVVVRNAIDNMGWIDMGGSLLVVDSLEHPELDTEIFAALEQRFPDTPVQWVVNTHTHYDHVALNGALQMRFGAEIVNARTCPTTESGRTIHGRSRSVEILPVTGCHTPDDWALWVPDAKILFVGDVFGWGLIPWDGNLRADKAAYIQAVYERFLALEPETVVSGHGPLANSAILARWLRYFRDLLERIPGLVAQGLDDAAISRAVAPPDDMHDWWRFLAWKHEDTVKKIRRSAAKGHLAPPPTPG